jgi:hypothetical protein
MGEIADMMLNGTLCQGCGVYLGSDNGYPTLCSSCKRERIPNPITPPRDPNKVACRWCRRHVKVSGLADHMRVKHNKT